MQSRFGLWMGSLGLVVACAAVLVTRTPGSVAPAVSAPTPFQLTASVVESEEYIGPAGETPYLSARYVFAIREDGSTATVTQTFDRTGKLAASDRRIRLSEGIRAEVADHLKAVTATRDPGMSTQPRSSSEIWTSESNCEAAADGINRRPKSTEGENLLGFETRKIVEESATMRLTRWFAPALGCAELRQLAEFKGPNGSITDISERRAVAGRSGRPDDSLFTWPDDYENIPASEKYLLAIEKCGCALNSETLAALRKSDAWFHQHKLIRD